MAEKVNGRRKAAMFLLSMGKDTTIKVFQHLRDEEVESLTMELAKIPKLGKDEQQAVIEEFAKVSKIQGYVSKGGVQYAREVLESALGKDRAAKIMSGLTSSFQVMPFDFLNKATPEHITRFIQEEQPQTIALIISYLTPAKAGLVLSMLPDDVQPEVARRIAVMDQTPPDVIRQVEKVLELKLSSVVVQDFSNQGGVHALVEVINSVDRGTEKKILDYLDNIDTELADEVKNLMFVFDDIINLDDRMMQRLLQDVDMKDLPVALKTVSENLKEKIFKNLSDRAVQTLQEEMEYMGPIRVKEVEEVQRKIVNIVRNLEEAGEIVISRGGDVEEFV